VLVLAPDQGDRVDLEDEGDGGAGLPGLGPDDVRGAGRGGELLRLAGVLVQQEPEVGGVRHGGREGQEHGRQCAARRAPPAPRLPVRARRVVRYARLRPPWGPSRDVAQFGTALDCQSQVQIFARHCDSQDIAARTHGVGSGSLLWSGLGCIPWWVEVVRSRVRRPRRSP
jgi:hypothetical protein